MLGLVFRFRASGLALYARDLRFRPKGSVFRTGFQTESCMLSWFWIEGP